KELPEAEVVHQAQLVGGEGAPRVMDRDRPAGLAAVGVALVHRDAAELVLECFHRVEHRGRPIADAGVQAPAGGDQQREASASFLVTDADVAFFIKRHVSLSLHNVVSSSRAGTWRRRSVTGTSVPECADRALAVALSVDGRGYHTIRSQH